MSFPRIFFLRHGQTEHSRENHFCGAGLNPDLTADGKEMASSFAEIYKDHSFKAVYSSSLKRAIQTATPVVEARGMTLETRDDLKEIRYGDWEGKTVEEVDKAYHDDYIRWTADPAWHAPTGGETAIAIAQRAMNVISEIREKYSSGDILVVSHKATIRIAIAYLLGIDVGRFRFRLDCPVCSLSVVEFARQGPWLRRLADRSHLSKRLRELPGT